jgi:hypothetical protein
MQQEYKNEKFWLEKKSCSGLSNFYIARYFDKTDELPTSTSGRANCALVELDKLSPGNSFPFFFFEIQLLRQAGGFSHQQASA